MLPSHYSKFCNAAGIGILLVEKRDTFFNMYKKFVQEEYEDLDSKNISVNIHTHDRNMAINKFVRERKHGFPRNQNVFGVA